MMLHLRATRTAGRPGRLSSWRFGEGLSTPWTRQEDTRSFLQDTCIYALKQNAAGSGIDAPALAPVRT
jgi:hypothetical protein